MTEAGRDSGIEGARRIVLKIGSALLIDEASGALRRGWLRAFADDVAPAAQRGAGKSRSSPSGAIAFGPPANWT